MKKGISLVALVITIIVLIILTAAVILTATNSNIFNKANEAKEAQNRQEVYELVQREVLETQLEIGGQGISQEFATNLQQKLNTKYPNANATASYANGKITISYTLNGKAYELELNNNMSLVMKDNNNGGDNGEQLSEEDIANLAELETYILGANKEGRNWSEICRGTSIIDEDILEEDVNAVFLNKMLIEYDITQENGIKYANYIKYKDVAYKVTTIISNINEWIETTQSLERTYVKNGMEGTVVEFSADGNPQNKTNWLVLYDNGDTVDIMSINTMGSYELGKLDTNATGSTNLEKAIDSYNNAVDILNTACEELITNEDAIAVRSIGSNPNFNAQDTTSTYSHTNLVNWESGVYNNIGKVTDMNVEQDVVRMSYFYQGYPEGSYPAFGYAKANNIYWLGSRIVFALSDWVYFSVRDVRGGNADDSNILWMVNDGEATCCEELEFALRPVVRVLKTNVSVN